MYSMVTFFAEGYYAQKNKISEIKYVYKTIYFQ